MKGTLKIGKTTVQQGARVFGLYLQKGKHRWWHIPTLGRKDLKQVILRNGQRDFAVGDRDIWDLEDCTCTRCAGTGLYAWAFENGKPKPSCSGPCHQCQGKGYLSYSDERRTETYWEHRVVSA